MKVLSSLTFYYIPKFLKNDLIKRSEINIHHHLMECSFLSFTMQKQVYGGAKRDRTADLLHAMQALSQLSYSPGFLASRPSDIYNIACAKLASPRGLEPLLPP